MPQRQLHGVSVMASVREYGYMCSARAASVRECCSEVRIGLVQTTTPCGATIIGKTLYNKDFGIGFPYTEG